MGLGIRLKVQSLGLFSIASEIEKQNQKAKASVVLNLIFSFFCLRKSLKWF